jgi:hypothetical protein
MSDTPTTSQIASVAPTEGNLKRSIRMKMFTSDEQKKRVAYTNQSEPLGQIVGEIFTVKIREYEAKNGDQVKERVAIGDFEGVVYGSGEVFTSTSAYLPDYFLETVEEFQALGAKSMDVALEIILVPTGKNIPISYEVRPLVARAPQSAVNRMKAALQAQGRLKLPPPVEQKALEFSDPVDDNDGSDADQPKASATEDAETPAKGRREKATADA